MTQAKPRRRSRGWVAFFVILVSLAAAGAVLPILYNRGQQLRPEQLDAARGLWREAGPADYDLTFSVQYDREPSAERHIVLVRGGRPVYASGEGEVVYVGPGLGALLGVSAGPAQGRALDVPAIFDRVGAMLGEDESGRNFLVAVFDPKAGWPRRVIRRVRGTSSREEWNLRVWPPGELERQARR
jgi:hypothetical protein